MYLHEIAAQMYNRLKTTDQGATSYRLPRGLVLVLRRQDRQWTLAAGRKDTYPSTQELYICARAFNVPPGTEPEYDIRRGYHVVEFNWLEEEAKPQQSRLIDQPPVAY